MFRWRSTLRAGTLVDRWFPRHPDVSLSLLPSSVEPSRSSGGKFSGWQVPGPGLIASTKLLQAGKGGLLAIVLTWFITLVGSRIVGNDYNRGASGRLGGII